jgi:hypothetical protein
VSVSFSCSVSLSLPDIGKLSFLYIHPWCEVLLSESAIHLDTNYRWPATPTTVHSISQKKIHNSRLQNKLHTSKIGQEYQRQVIGTEDGGQISCVAPKNGGYFWERKREKKMVGVHLQRIQSSLTVLAAPFGHLKLGGSNWGKKPQECVIKELTAHPTWHTLWLTTGSISFTNTGEQKKKKCWHINKAIHKVLSWRSAW